MTACDTQGANKALPLLRDGSILAFGGPFVTEQGMTEELEMLVLE